jgi:hypothetical protein
VRQAIRDAVNRSSRKPFTWGGLSGYEQLEAIEQGLGHLPDSDSESHYLRVLRTKVAWVLAKNRSVADDLKRTHRILHQVAHCLHYPPDPQADQKINRQQVAREMSFMIQDTHPVGKIQTAQTRLLDMLKRRWELFGQELLPCYEINGLPQDNLKLESLFGHLRRRQRRTSGRKSTRELQYFGQVQVLFGANSQQELLKQIQLVPFETFRIHRNRLAQAELPRQFLYRLRRDALATISALVQLHSIHYQMMVKCEVPGHVKDPSLHTS